MNLKFYYSLFYLLLVVLSNSACNQKTIERRFKLPSVLKEVSGLYLEDAQHFWWLNDGGDAPVLYITDGKGELIDTILLSTIKNKDWEDLTNDDSGNIYIGDFGNNRNQRKDLRIYIYNKNTAAIDSIVFQYPDQYEFPPQRKNWNYDMEAFLWHNDELHLFSKNKVGQGNYYCKHYTLNDQPGNQIAVLKDSIYFKSRVVTAAAISPDKQTVALLAYDYKKLLGLFPFSRASIYYFTEFEDNHFFKGRMRKRRAPTFIIATQFESLDFLSNKKLYVASEQTVFIKPKAKQVKVRP